MSDTSMLTIADRLSVLKEQKSDLMAQMKDLNRQIDEATNALVQMMVDQNLTGRGFPQESLHVRCPGE